MSEETDVMEKYKCQLSKMMWPESDKAHTNIRTSEPARERKK